VSPLQQVALAQRGSASTPTAFSATSPLYLFEPRAAYRMRYVPQAGASDQPEYPPPGARIDYYLASEPAGELKVEILDSTGATVRSFTSEAVAPRSGSPQEMRMAARFGLTGARVTKRPGLNRFVWDMRHVGPWDKNSPNGGPGGPLVVPGAYQVRLSAGDTAATRPLDVRIDPRVTAAGVTPADLREQTDLLLKVRDAISESRRLQDRLAQAMEKAGVKPPPPPGPGETPGTVTYAHPLQATWAKLVTAPGPYPQPMLIDQFMNIARMLGQGDQKPGKDAWDRYNDLMKTLSTLRGEADRSN
jgi:hypothetical protein